jgi:hypothetical protein
MACQLDTKLPDKTAIKAKHNQMEASKPLPPNTLRNPQRLNVLTGEFRQTTDSNRPRKERTRAAAALNQQKISPIQPTREVSQTTLFLVRYFRLIFASRMPWKQSQGEANQKASSVKVSNPDHLFLGRYAMIPIEISTSSSLSDPLS